MIKKFWIYLSSALLIALLWYRGQAARGKLKLERERKLAALKSKQTLEDINTDLNKLDVKLQEDLDNADDNSLDNKW